MNDRLELIPGADLNEVGEVGPRVDCRGMMKAYVQVRPSAGDVPGTAVLAALRAMTPNRGDPLTVAFGAPPALDETGATIVEVDVSETPYMALRVTTAEGALSKANIVVYLTDEGA